MNENEITIEAYRLLYTPEYIERDAAISALCCDCSVTRDCRPGERCADYMRLKAIPAADVRPVVRGKWMDYARRGIYGMLYACSECGAKYTGRSPFCPNCGAKMEKS